MGNYFIAYVISEYPVIRDLFTSVTYCKIISSRCRVDGYINVLCANFMTQIKQCAMKRVIWSLYIILLSVTLNGQIKRVETEHFQASYEVEAEKYVLASLEVLELARDLASKTGYDLPDKLQFSVIRSERNVLYFSRKKLNGIIWEYNSMENFLPPGESRKKNVYGLCHEIGHLCMYHITNNKNNWMSYDYRESWADFFGNYLIDSVYHYLGADFWPEPHDYRESAGMEFFLQRIERDNPELLSFNKSSLFWYELNSKLEFRNMPEFFEKIKNKRVRNPDAKQKYLDVLKASLGEDDITAWFNDYADYLILDK